MSTPGAMNVQRRKWDTEEYAARARARHERVQQAARRDDDEGLQVLGEELIGRQASNEDADVESLQEKALTALSAKPGEAGPLGSRRAYLKHRPFQVDIDGRAGRRTVVTDATPANRTGGFYCPVTKVTLRDSLSYLDHINGKKYHRALGYSMRAARATADDVRSVLAKASSSSASAAAGPVDESSFRSEYEARVAEREASEREAARARRTRKRKRKRGLDHDGSDGNVEEEGGGGDDWAEETSAKRPRPGEDRFSSPSHQPHEGSDASTEDEDVDPVLAAIMGVPRFERFLEQREA